MQPMHTKTARRIAQGKEQRLQLVIATHEITLRRNALRRIETAMQRRGLLLLTNLPSNQRSSIAAGQPMITEIAVKQARHWTSRLKPTRIKASLRQQGQQVGLHVSSCRLWIVADLMAQ